MSGFYAVSKIKAQGAQAARVDIYGEISASGFWGDGKTPSAFIAELDALGPVSGIDVHIFSQGGDPFAACAIYAELERRPEKVSVYVDGLAASAATLILCAGDTVYMGETSMLMVHNPHHFIAFEGLNAEGARRLAAELDKVREPMIACYMKKTAKTREEVIALMDGESGAGTWLTAAEALSFGLADAYAPEDKKPLQAAASVAPGKFNFRGVSVDASMYDKAAEKTAGITNNARGGNPMGLFGIGRRGDGKKPAAQQKARAEVTLTEMACPCCGGAVCLNPESGEVFEGAAKEAQEPDQTPKAALARRMAGNFRARLFDVPCPHCGERFAWDTDAQADGDAGQPVKPAAARAEARERARQTYRRGCRSRPARRAGRSSSMTRRNAKRGLTRRGLKAACSLAPNAPSST